MMIPTIHLNGTNEEALLEEVTGACQSIREAECGLCGKGTKAHRKANNVRYVRRRSGVSGLKVLKPRSARIRRWEGTYETDRA